MRRRRRGGRYRERVKEAVNSHDEDEDEEEKDEVVGLSTFERDSRFDVSALARHSNQTLRLKYDYYTLVRRRRKITRTRYFLFILICFLRGLCCGYEEKKSTCKERKLAVISGTLPFTAMYFLVDDKAQRRMSMDDGSRLPWDHDRNPSLPLV